MMKEFMVLAYNIITFLCLLTIPLILHFNIFKGHVYT